MEELTSDLSTEETLLKDITWKINNFYDKPAAADFSLTSPQFAFANATWQLQLYPNGISTTPASAGFILLYVVRLISSVPDHVFTASWSLKTGLGTKDKSLDVKCVVNNKSTRQCLAFRARSELRDYKHLLFPNGTLTVCCQIRMLSFSGKEQLGSCTSERQVGGEASSKELHDEFSQTETLDFSASSVQPEISSSVHKLQSDYKKLLESEEDTDVCLKVSDKEFRAHKCILGARSSVFSAMFKHDTEEKASGEVVIEDMDPESFPDFLQHMYAGCIDDLSEDNVFNLFIAADKYDMTDLKSNCKSYMERTLSVDTFCDVMSLALRYQEAELLKHAIDFFVNNLAEIIVTVKWQIFSKDHNTEANELLIKAIVPTYRKGSKT